jgi:Protein of unknown function (DUF433)
MALEISYPHVERPAGEAARLCRFPRVRIAQLVMDYLAYGWSVEELCRQYSYLNPAEAHAAMAYYFDHQEEIDEEIRLEWNEADAAKSQLPPSRFLARLRSQGQK